VDPADLVDLDRYPVTDPHGTAGRAVVERHRQELTEHGVSILPGFVTEQAVGLLVAEADALAPVANFQDVHGTPYLGLPDDQFPPDHPRNALSRSALSAIAYDLFPAESPLRALYEWDALMAFVGLLLDREPLYRYADPLGALNVAVMREGDELGWHFDQTDFVVSIALQSSLVGGDFANAENLRAADDERYDDVSAVLDGRAPERVATVPMTPGTLMLFAGRYSMHAVTPVVGPVPRYVALLAYDTRPDTNSSELLKLVRYGRAA
jgi:hypothetical protein